MALILGAPVTEQDVWTTDPLRIALCRDAILASNEFQNRLRQMPPGSRLPIPVVTGLGNGLVGPETVLGSRNVARCIFEDTRLDGLDTKLTRFDVLLCASNWNARLLKAHSRKPVELVFEGIDPSLFHPGPKSGLLDPNRFYIFSGGKVEFRNDPTGIVHAVVGKASFDAAKLVENVRAFIDHMFETVPEWARTALLTLPAKP